MKKCAANGRGLGSGRWGLIHRILALCMLGYFSVTLAAEEPLTIHLWHQRPAPSRAVLHDLINQYEQENPGVEIQLLYKENEELRMGYQAAAAFTGGGPEILYGPSDFTGALDEMQIVKPLETLFDSTFLSDFDPNGLTRYNGHLYQIGDELGNHLALVWNRRLFREAGLDRAPRTLDELIEFGQKLTLDIDGDGVTDQYGLVWNYTEPFFFVPFYSSFGGWVMDADGNPTLDNDAAVKAFQFVVDLRDKYKIIPRECDYDIADSKFNTGRAAMLINGAWAWAKYMESPDVEFGLAVLPENAATGKYPAPMVATKGYWLNPYLDDTLLAESVKLIKFLTSPAAQLDFARRTSIIPTRFSVRNLPEVLDDPVISTSVKQVELGRAMPIGPEMRAIWDAMRPAYQNVLGGNMTPEEGAAYMQKLAVQKIGELYEGQEETTVWNTIMVVLVYALGIFLAIWAMYKLVTGFIKPLMKNPESGTTRNARFAVWMVLPAAIFLFAVVVFPFGYNLVISLSNMGMTTVNSWRIIGFGQYGKVFTDPNFYHFLWRTIVWTLSNVVVHVTVGVFLAMLLNRPLWGKGIMRVILVLPWAVPSYITALTWRGMFNTDSGAINLILRNLFGIEPIPWLTDATNAFLATIITNIWLGIPFMMVIALGGLQAIPRELYEAAEIDGASSWQQFKKITLPLLKPVMLPAITLGIVWTFNNINVVWLVSNGGQPGDQTHILVSFVYRAAFNLYRYGYAAAFSFVIFLMLAAFSIKFMQRSGATRTAY